MAKMRHMDPKAALSEQRAELRRDVRGKEHIGDDTGSAAGRAAEREKVHHMQELQHARQVQDGKHGREEAERREDPIFTILADLAGDSFRLARTLVTLPFRLLAALRARRRRTAEV